MAQLTVTNELHGSLHGQNDLRTTIDTAINPTYALTTEAGAQIQLFINSSDYKMYATLRDKSGNLIYTSNIIDLPLETMVVDGEYDAETKEVVLILDNGNEVRFSVADLVEGLVSTETLDSELLKYVLKSKFGFDQSAQDKINFAVIEGTRNGVGFKEFWVLSNAYYNYSSNLFCSADVTANSFGIQIQMKGTYPGEESVDPTNVGINIWRHAAGAGATWNSFGVTAGWINHCMYDSYGGITIGGAGLEVDGNGIFPYTRLTSSAYTDSNNKVWYLLGILDNAYHPTVGGAWGLDTNKTYSWFVGLRTPASSISGLNKNNEQSEFVIMYNDTPYNAGSPNSMDIAKWHIVCAIGINGINIDEQETKVTETGENVSVNQTAYAPMEMILKGNTSQKTTTGINQFTTGTGTSNRINVNVTYNESETTINGTSNSAGNIYYDSSLPNNAYRKSKRLKAGDYTIKFEKVSGDKTFPSGVGFAYYLRDSELTQIIGVSNVENNIYTFTLNEDTDIYSQIYVNGANAVFTNYVLRTQIVSGTYTSSNFPDYEPYTNGASPNPTYPQPINVVSGDNTIKVYGKNLFDKNTPKANYYYDGSGNQVPSSQTYINQEIPLSNKYTISFSVNHSSNVRIVEFGDNDTFINRTLINTTPNTITTNANTKKVIVCVDHDTSQNKYFENLMIEAGESASAYEPYKQNAVLLTLGDKEICWIGNYKDRIFKAIKGDEIYDGLSNEEKNTLDYGKWYLRKAIKKVVLDGSETPSSVSVGTNTTRASYNHYADGSTGSQVYCNLLTYVPNWGNDVEGVCYDINNGGFWFRMNKSTIGTTSDSVKTYLSSNNLICYLPLATPTNELFNDIQQEQLEDIYNNMLSYEGQTNISQINNDAPFKITATALLKVSGE